MKTILTLLILLSCSFHSFAWDYEGHRVVNQLALASLPTNFPPFVRTPAAQERIAFLSGEADRWRNNSDLPLKHFNAPDHYLDMEDLEVYGLTPETLPPLRYQFVARLALERAAHPEKFPAIDPAKNEDHTRELIGFLPWTITEYFGKLKSSFSYLKAFQEAGTTEEIANAQQNAIYIMGVMGHFVGDATQPLHMSKHHNGWVGENPNKYTTRPNIHQWIDGGYFDRFGFDFPALKSRVRPASLIVVASTDRGVELFQKVISFLNEQHKLVEPLYKLEKEGKISGQAEQNAEGKEFLSRQLILGGEMLGSLWLSAWEQARPDTYLKNKLAKRTAGEAKP